MTTTQKRLSREEIERAVLEGVKDEFAKGGEILPHALLLTHDGGIFLLPGTMPGLDFFASHEGKEAFAATVGMVASETPDLAAVAIVTEAWMRTLQCSECSDLRECPHVSELVRNRSNFVRREVVTVSLEFVDPYGAVFCLAAIERPSGAPPALAKWERNDVGGPMRIEGVLAAPFASSFPTDPLKVN